MNDSTQPDIPQDRSKKMTILIGDDPGPAQVEADIAALKNGSTSKVVRAGASELYLSQLRLLVAKEPQLAEDIEIFWTDAFGVQHLIGLDKKNEARWPPGFMQRAWEIEIQISKYHRDAEGLGDRDPSLTTLSVAYERIARLETQLADWKSGVESIALMAGMDRNETWGMLDIMTFVREQREKLAAVTAPIKCSRCETMIPRDEVIRCADCKEPLCDKHLRIHFTEEDQRIRQQLKEQTHLRMELEAENARLKAPISDKEWTEWLACTQDGYTRREYVDALLSQRERSK
jgi:hypothetical protein